MSTVSERERFDFEREKWRAETAVRTREVSAKERDIAGSKWRSPLVVAVLAAAAAAMGNAVVVIVNGSQQVALENSKAESARILEMTKTGDTEAAANNLKFLLAAGLIAEPDRVERVRAYLETRVPGAGPALPAAGGRVSFDPTDALNADIKGTLEGVLKTYSQRLNALGLDSDDRRRDQVRLPHGLADFGLQTTGHDCHRSEDGPGPFGAAEGVQPPCAVDEAQTRMERERAFRRD